MREWSRRVLAVVVIAASTTAAPGSEPSWTRWGGPTQNFKAPAEGIATVWPADGPRRLWTRELGDGFSGVLAEDGRLYTMYRSADQEVVIALDAQTGKTIWERRYDHDPHDGYIADRGDGPRSTPLLSGDRIYTIGVAGRMHCLAKGDGEILWSRELWGEELGGTVLQHGYSSSPIEYGDTVIALVGGEGQGIVAFDKEDGRVVWSNLDFDNSYSSPQILTIEGQEQLVTFMATQLVGVDPENGELLWSYPVENQYGENITPPIVIDGRYLFLSSVQVGSRGLKLTRNESGVTEVEEVWSTRRVQLYHVTSVEQDGYVYGSSGPRPPQFLSAIHAKTGEIAWRKRGFSKANVVLADDRLIVLNEDGTLYLTTVTPDDLTVHSKADVLDALAWTAPTIVGSKLYARDRSHITAFDLSTQGDAADALPAEAPRAAAEEITTASAATPTPAPAPTINPDEPVAVQILKRADAAARAIDSIYYKATTTPIGRATGWIPATEGETILAGWNGTMPARFWARITTVQPDSDKADEFTGGANGETFFLLDHRSKRAYSDFDPNVLGKAGRALSAIQLPELVHPTPFADEIGAESVELVGEEEVGGVPCHKVRVVYGASFGESTWFLSKEDHLPRRRIRVFGGIEASVDTTLTDLEVNPDTATDRFTLELPDGYELIDDFAP